MKKLIISLSLLASLAATAAKPSSPQINSVEPPYWWTGMANDTLQIMLSGPRIGLTETSMKPYEGVSLIESVRLDSPNYLLLYLTVSDTAKPGVLDFTFSDGKKKAALRYELKERSKAVKAQGFDASDVLYLIMPDRFARAGATTDAEASRGLEYAVEVDRADLNARHGGNIAGMEQHLGYIDSLGVTAIWVNPVLENDMPGGSYHGYATTDYYRHRPAFRHQRTVARFRRQSPRPRNKSCHGHDIQPFRFEPSLDERYALARLV